jgi:D-alanyl-D-alanine carboxypeptidase
MMELVTSFNHVIAYSLFLKTTKGINMQPFNNLKSTLSGTAIALLLTACGSGSTSKEVMVVEPTPVVVLDYQKLIESKISDDVPGIILLVNTPERQFIGSAGVSDRDKLTPMQTTDVFSIQSAGKVITALLAAQLHDEALLNLDDTLDTWLPLQLLDQIQYSEQITLRQLLNHSSGIVDYNDNEMFVQDVLASPEVQRGNVDLVNYALNKTPYALPGAGFHYSSTNYALAGMILDEVFGYHNAVEIRARIIEPLSLSSMFSVGYENHMDELIPGYELYQGQYINTAPIISNVFSSASPVASTVTDLAFFYKSLITDTDFVSDDIRELMWGATSLVPVETNNYAGLGIHKNNVNGTTLYNHDGGGEGYLTQNIYIEETDTSIVYFLNCGLSDACIAAFYAIEDAVLTELSIN